jgi:hypothetical protein
MNNHLLRMVRQQGHSCLSLSVENRNSNVLGFQKVCKPLEILFNGFRSDRCKNTGFP